MKKIILSIIAITLAIASFGQGNGYLGISMKTVENGVRISEVLEKGSAFTFGLKMNDIIQEIDGIKINTNSQLKSFIESKNWGDNISISYLRNGLSENKNVTLGNRANKIEYKIIHKVKGKTATWNFDNKIFITEVDGIPTKIEKTEGDKVFTLSLNEESIIPQNFSDYEDKMEMITAIKKKHAAKRWIPTITYFIKTYTSESKIEKPVAKNNATLKVYPNPSNGVFNFDFKTLDLNENLLTWSVIDIAGKEILNEKSTKFEDKFSTKIDLTNLANGTYLLKVVNNKEVFTERLIIKN